MANASVKEQVGDLVTKAKRRVGVEHPSAADDEGNVGIVRGALRTFGEGNADEFLDALKDDVVWEGPNGGHFPGGGEQLGRDAVKSEFVENVGRTFTDFGFIPESFIDADDANAVVVIGRFEGDGVEGDRVDEPAVQVWELQGTAVSRVRIFTDSAGFPAVITERRQEELEQKEREEKEKREKEEEKDSGEGDRDEAKAEKKDDSEAKSDGDGAKAEKKDESESDDESKDGDAKGDGDGKDG